MKKIISAAIVLFAGTSVYAQVAKKSTSASTEISVNAGIASPMGNFAKGDYDDLKSGFSKSGIHLNLSGIYYIKSNWGINAVLGYTQFGSKGLQSLVNGYKEDSGTDSTTLSSTGKSSSFNLLVGPVYKIPVCSSFSIQLRALAGYTNTTLAGFKVYYEDFLANTVMAQKQASAGAFGFQLGAGVNYKVSNTISILANADYFSSTPKFNVMYENYNVTAGRKINTYNETISGINATLGIGFSF